MDKKSLMLLAIIFLEGYVVLSAELLAIRSTLPYFGSGTDTISIIIAAVLMPLAFGYHAGGRFRATRLSDGTWSLPRLKLARNFMISAIILTLGLSYASLDVFFELMLKAFGITDRLALAVIYSAIFLAVPVFLLGQTIPLAGHFFPREKLSTLAGRILFFSTLGSFMGAVFCTLVLMTFLGVHNTAVVTIGCLAALTIAVSRKPLKLEPLVAFGCFALAILLNSGTLLRNRDIVDNNRYNLIAIFETEDGSRYLSLNKNFDSKIGPNGEKHNYIEYAERTFLDPITEKYGNRTPRNILVIGAGGFTFGLDDGLNEYDYVDIDGSLKEIAEEHFLKQKLGANKRFHPVPARAFLTGTEQEYDLIFIDAYYGNLSVPEHLVTREFYETVKSRLTDDGVLVINIILSPTFGDAFSRNFDTTLRSVFPFITRDPVFNYDGWDMQGVQQMNVIYAYHNALANEQGAVYTDDKNRMFLDRSRTVPVLR